MMRRRRNVVIDSDDDCDDFGNGFEGNSFPSLEPPRPSTRGGPNTKPSSKIDSARARDASGLPGAASVRVRKLGCLDNDPTLLRSLRAAGAEAGDGTVGGRRSAWAKAADSTIDLPDDEELSPTKKPQRRQTTRPRVALRTRNTRRASTQSDGDMNDSAGELSTEEASVLEDVTLEKEEDNDNGDDNGDNDEEDEGGEDDDAASSDSEFRASSSEDDDLFLDSLDDDDVFSWSPTKARAASPKKKTAATIAVKGTTNTARKTTGQGPQPPTVAPTEDPSYDEDSSSVFFSAEEFPATNLVKPLSELSLNPKSAPRPGTPPRSTTAAPTTAKTTGLVSPTKKLPLIPQTPHRPNTDAFWDQLVVDDWNTEHSPRKLLFGDPDSKGTKGARKTPGSGLSPSKKAVPGAAAPTAKQLREAKKQFQQEKHARAEQFLAELDRTVTEGALARLAAATGGVRIVWTNKLNTTAGRANWRRETLRRKAAAGASGAPAGPADAERVLHHASIELAEKVIDDEHRLLNVLAHEFCHLACFMVSGVTTQPHGRAFKQWAAQCSRHFGRSHGIEVTTKHTYEIDFKYVWTCAAPECATQFKRHSKSIDPTRHRCGVCRGLLVQTKPVPRGGGSAAAAGKGASAGAGAGGAGAGPSAGRTPAAGPSAYQLFMKEHMAAVRQANPGSPQKEIMKLVAGKWSEAKALQKQKTADAAAETKTPGTASVDDLGKVFVDLTLS